MQDKNYTVKRKDIYVGELVRTSYINGAYENDDEHDCLTVSEWFPIRSMLFVPDEKNWSNDLLYQSPNYPILNMTDNDTCLNLGHKALIIKDACGLEPLLEYFGYPEKLTYKDIIKIRKTFFTGKFAREHCELFGYKEMQPEDATYYTGNFEEVTDLVKLKLLIMKEKMAQLQGHRQFGCLGGKYPLPRYYFDLLDQKMGDKTLLEFLRNPIGKVNAFVPVRNEGPVRKLRR